MLRSPYCFSVTYAVKGIVANVEIHLCYRSNCFLSLRGNDPSVTFGPLCELD